MTVATVSDGGHRRNSANAGSSRPAARKSEPFLKASLTSSFSSPTSQTLSKETPANINIGRPRSRRTCMTYSISVSISSSATMAMPVKTAMSLRLRSGIKSTPTIASSIGISHSSALAHDGEMMVRSCSTSARRAAVTSEIVANWPEGSTDSAATRAGEVSTNTVAPRSGFRSASECSSALTSIRGSSA